MLGKPSDKSTSRLPRLLVLSSTYPRWSGDPEPGFVHELAKRLVGRFEVTVLCPHASGAKRIEQLDGVRVIRYGYAPASWETLVNDGGIVANLKRHPWRCLLVPSFVVCQWLALWRLKFRWCPDLIHAHWLLPQGVIAANAGTTPYVVTSHGADLFALNGRVFAGLRNRVAIKAAAVTVVSSGMREKLRKECAGRHVHIMPMGVDMDERFTEKANVIRSSNRILFVGRLVEKKGLIHLINAMPRIREACPAATLDIVGFGPEKEVLSARVRELGLDESVGFVGAVTQADLPKRYQSAAVFVAPFIEAAGGDQEGLGLVVAEAIGCGCPVVVGNVPAIHDLISEEANCVVPQRDVDAIANAVIRVLKNPEASRREMIDLRSRVQEKFSWTSVAGGYANLFECIIETRGRNEPII